MPGDICPSFGAEGGGLAADDERRDVYDDNARYDSPLAFPDLLCFCR